MKMIQLTKMIEALARDHQKHVFHLHELVTLTQATPEAVAMALGRLKNQGWVERLGSLWVNLVHPPQLQEIAFSLRSPAYLSFETALYQAGILSQSPKGKLSVATTGRPGRVQTPWGEIEFIHLASRLFFGFDSKCWAYPEKALLDMMYVRTKRGEEPLPRGVTLYPSELNQKKLRLFSKSFPQYIQNMLSTAQRSYR